MDHPRDAACLVAERGLEHLTREESALEQTLEALRRLRAALLHGGRADVEEALKHQEESARATAGLRQARADFTRDVAEALAIPPDQVTLQALVGACPGETGERLACGRERLRRLAAEAQRLQENNAFLMYHCMDFLSRYLLGLTGGGRGSGCYGPAGTHTEAARGSLLSLRG